MTAMQAKIANSIGGSTFDMFGVDKIRSQFETIERIRAEITQKLADQSVGQHPDFLNALVPSDFSEQLKQRLDAGAAEMNKVAAWKAAFNDELIGQRVGQHPDFLNALIPPNEAEQLKNRLLSMNRELDSGTKKTDNILKTFFGGVLGRGSIYAVVAFAASRAIDGITDAHKRLRESDKTATDYINAWAEGIPVFGRVARSAREMAAELSGANEAAESVEKIKAAMKSLDELHSGMKSDYSSLTNTPAANAQMTAGTEHNARLDKINASEKELTASKERLLKILDFIEHVPLMGAKIEELKSKINSVGSDIPQARTESLDLYIKRLAEIDEDAAKPIRDITAALDEQIATFGKSAGEIAIWRAKLAGADPSQMANVIMSANHLQGLEDEKKKVDERIAAEKKAADEALAAAKRKTQENESYAESVKKMIQTKEQAFAEEERKLEEIRKLKLITDEEFFAARNKFSKDIFGDMPKRKKESALSGLLPSLAAEESRFLTRSRDVVRIDPAVEAAKTLKESKDLQRKHLKATEDTNKAIKNMPVIEFTYGRL
jgi:hypothetical protein